MNRRLFTARHRSRFSRVVLLLAAVMAGGAWVFPSTGAPAAPVTGAPAAPATPATPAAPAPKPLSNDFKLNPNFGPADYPTVDAFVKGNIARLTGADADAASAARSELIAASVMRAIPGSKDPANPAYLGYYLTSLSSELRSALGQKPGVRVKVNLGIVTAKVAENVKAIVPPGLQLRNVILSLMQDPCDAVALWGTKAAASSLTAKDRTVPNTPLTDQLVPTVESHKLNGAITDEAYAALQDMDQPKVIPTLLRLYEVRVAAYKNGVPPEPAVDARASTTLTVQAGMWTKLTPKERSKVMSLIADQLAGGVKAITEATDAEVVDQLRQSMIRTSQAVVVVSRSLNNGQGDPNLEGIASRGGKMGATTPVPVVVSTITPIIDAVRKAFPPM